MSWQVRTRTRRRRSCWSATRRTWCSRCARRCAPRRPRPSRSASSPATRCAGTARGPGTHKHAPPGAPVRGTLKTPQLRCNGAVWCSVVQCEYQLEEINTLVPGSSPLVHTDDASMTRDVKQVTDTFAPVDHNNSSRSNSSSRRSNIWEYSCFVSRDASRVLCGWGVGVSTTCIEFWIGRNTRNTNTGKVSGVKGNGGVL